MIDYYYEVDFGLNTERKYSDWITRVIGSEKGFVGDINFIFCDDEYLLQINQKYLRHDSYTDIITFDYSEGKELSGDIFISVERVKDNAKAYDKTFHEELLRVMAHGILHMLGYNDKSEEEIKDIREREEEKMLMFHVEQD